MDAIQICRIFEESRAQGTKDAKFQGCCRLSQGENFCLESFFTKSATPKSFAYSLTTTNPESYPMCRQRHPLYRCKVFKSKFPRERNDFVKQKKICFNCIILTKHNLKKCKSSIRCRVQGCGKTYHVLLHFTKPREGENQQRDNPNSEDVNQGLRPDQGATSMCSTVAAVNSCKALFKSSQLK